MSDHALDSAPRTESELPRVVTRKSRRRFVTSAIAALVGGALVHSNVSARQPVFAPAQLAIPSIDLFASIEQVQIVDGVMQTPEDPHKVGWYSQLSFPGQGSNVVMAGHKDWWNIGPAVFWDLSALDVGDDIELTSTSGDQLTYRVMELTQFSASTPPTEYTTADFEETLTLITCSGQFTANGYEDRLVVRAVLQP